MTTPRPDTDSVTVTATSSVSGPPAAVADLLHRLQAAGVIDDTGQVDPAALATVLPLPARAQVHRGAVQPARDQGDARGAWLRPR
jgi:hypothetical protein